MKEAYKSIESLFGIVDDLSGVADEKLTQLYGHLDKTMNDTKSKMTKEQRDKIQDHNQRFNIAKEEISKGNSKPMNDFIASIKKEV
ncbi:MAG: hypothetical protein WDZ41_01915 [Candidatus Babeliales bacterium]